MQFECVVHYNLLLYYRNQVSVGDTKRQDSLDFVPLLALEELEKLRNNMSLFQSGEKLPMRSNTKSPMYRYLYGSMGGSTLESLAESDVVADGTSSGSDMELLVGESLISLDEKDNSSKQSRLGLHRNHLSHSSNGGFSLSSFSTKQREEKRSHSYVTCLVCVFMSLSLVSSILALLAMSPSRPLLPHRLKSSSAGMTSPQLSFESVDRYDYGDPVENFVFKDLFHPNLLNSREGDPRTFVFPYPT